MAEECTKCIEHRNKIDERKRLAISRGQAWAKANGADKFVIAQNERGINWKYYAFDAPSFGNYKAIEYHYL